MLEIFLKKSSILIDIYPWFFLIYFSLFVYLLIKNYKILKFSFKEINKQTWLILSIICFLGFISILEYSDIKYDWDCATCEYRLVAKYLLLKQRAILCYEGAFENCIRPGAPDHPVAYPFLASLIFLFFGLSIKTLLIIQILIASISIILMFLLVYLITKNKFTSLIGASLLSFFPIYIYASAMEKISVEIFSLFFILLSLIIFLIWNKSMKNKKSNFYLNILFLLSVGLFMNVRAENVFIGIFIFLFIIFKKYFYKIKKELLITAPLLIAPIYHILFVWFSNFIMGRKEFSILYIQKNILELIQHWKLFFSPYIYFLPIVIFFLIFRKKYRKISIILICWFLFYSILYTCFILGPGGRYILITILPLILLISLFFDNIIKSLKIKRRLFMTILIISIFMFSSIIFTPRFETPDNDLNYLIKKICEENENVVIIFPSGNTAWCAIFETDNMFFTTIEMLHPENLYDYKEFYFLDTGRCEIMGIEEKCQYIINNSELLYTTNRINTYKVKNPHDVFENLVRTYN